MPGSPLCQQSDVTAPAPLSTIVKRYHMSMPLSSASKRTGVLLACFLSVPWALISVVWFGLLPPALAFECWPPLLQSISVVACVLYFIADTLFAAWYFLALVVDAYGGKPDGSA